MPSPDPMRPVAARLSHTWPDASAQEPPVGDRYASAAWLLGRHPHLAIIADRLPGIVNIGFDGLPDIDLDALAEALVDLDADQAAWAAYQEAHPAPVHDRGYDAWEAAGPSWRPTSRSLGKMSSTEVARLRLLAVFSSHRVPFGLRDTVGLDRDGRQLLTDWFRALLAHQTGPSGR
jgi:hypothetical protein